MTLANFMLEPRRVLAFSDTLATVTSPGRRITHRRTSKLDIVPHLHAVAIGRGSSFLADMARMDMDSFCSTFDEAVNKLPELLRVQRRHRAEFYSAQDRAPELYKELVRLHYFIAGWSPARDRMRLVAFRSEQDFAPVEALPGIHLEPAAGNATLPPTATLDQMVAVASAQRREMQQQRSAVGGGLSIGGELHVVEILPSRIGFRIVHRWPGDLPDAR